MDSTQNASGNMGRPTSGPTSRICLIFWRCLSSSTIGYSAFMEVLVRCILVSRFSPLLGLSPSIHSIDQIKVFDRFRGAPCDTAAIILPTDTPQRNPARRSYGGLGVVGSRPRERRLCYIPKVGNMKFRRALLTHSELEGQGIRSVLGSCTNSSTRTTCPTFFAPINSAWKDTLLFLTNTFQPSGRHRITATDVAIQPVSSKLGLEVRCTSTFLRLLRRMSAMDLVNKLPRMLVGRCVFSESSISNFGDVNVLTLRLHWFMMQLPEYFL